MKAETFFVEKHWVFCLFVGCGCSSHAEGLCSLCKDMSSNNRNTHTHSSMCVHTHMKEEEDEELKRER